MLLEKFYPYEYVESVLDIDFQKIHSLGYEALIFDIDATLVPHGLDVTPEIEQLFTKIHQIGLKTLFLSNNSDSRVNDFIRNIQSPFIANAQKPRIDGYLQALKLLNTTNDKAIMIGDQIFTDILGANRCKIPSILVKYLVQPHETKIGKKRRLERAILWLYQHNEKFCHRMGNIG